MHAVVVVGVKGGYRQRLKAELSHADGSEKVAMEHSLAWQVTPIRRANLLFLKPVASLPQTNMTVVTNLRRYNFQLTALGQPVRGMPFTVRFVYAAPVALVESAPPPDPPPEVRNAAYAFQGSRALLPVRIFDDGRDTYFAFRSDEVLPAVFAIDSDGAESVVNLRLRDGFFVADRIARGFVLRRGGDITRVFNEGFRQSETSQVPEKPRSFWRR